MAKGENTRRRSHCASEHWRFEKRYPHPLSILHLLLQLLFLVSPAYLPSHFSLISALFSSLALPSAPHVCMHTHNHSHLSVPLLLFRSWALTTQMWQSS